MAQVRRSRRLRAQRGSYSSATTIDTLPDNVLLEIFDFYRSQSHTYQEDLPHSVVLKSPWKWHLLVHVCRKWRQIILESPLRLNLQILCTQKTPVRKNLSIWPALPIAISYHPPGRSKRPLGQANVINALKHLDRVCYVSLDLTVPQLGKMVTVMQEPFPVLTYLYLNVSLDGGSAPVLPANFLGGSAPCLRTIHLRNIPFPAIPLLLLSASDLVKLELRNIPPTGYISPEAMVASLAALPKLEIFVIEFRSATSRPDLILPPPVIRAVLPSLTYFEFQGASEYLEDLVARIDSPQLDCIFTIYLKFVDIEVAQLSRFISRSVGPDLDPDKLAHFAFYSTGVGLAVHNHACPNHRLIWNSVICGGTNWQVSQIAQVLSRISAAFSNVVHLTLGTGLNGGRPLEGTDDVEWLLLLHQFSNVRSLHVSRELARHVALALEDVTAEMVTEVLPSLDLICIEGQRASSIEKFVTTRRVSGRPVTITNTEMEFNRRLKSYVRK